MKFRLIRFLAALQFLGLPAFAQENPLPEEPVFKSYACTLGTVTAHESGSYIIATTDGRVIGIPAESEPSPEAVEADIAAFAPATVSLRQDLETVMSRLSDTELAALLDSDDIRVRRFLKLAEIRGQVRADNPDTVAAVTLLADLEIIVAERWQTLLAP